MPLDQAQSLHKALPNTPADGVQIGDEFRREMERIFAEKEATGEWLRPWDYGATLYEEMTDLDKFYWVWKCQNAVTLPEEGVDIGTLMNRDLASLSLPQGFVAATSTTLGAGGDMFRVDGLENSHDVIFENVADLLFGQDISFANLESPVTHQSLEDEIISDQRSPTECSAELHFDALKGHDGQCWTMLHLANNHINDMGSEGLATTLNALDKNGIQPLGVNPSDDDFGQAVIYHSGGIKFGFVSTTFGLNGRELEAGDEQRVNVSNYLSKDLDPEFELVKRQIAHAQDEECDFIIASIHGGYEFEFFPRMRQVNIYREVIELGADAVIGHHPHVIQPAELYQTRRDPNRIAVIAYSLGSLMWSFSAPHLALNQLINLTFTKGELNGDTKTFIEAASLTPLVRSPAEKDGQFAATVVPLADLLADPEYGFDQGYLDKIKAYADLALGETWMASTAKPATKPEAA